MRGYNEGAANDQGYTGINGAFNLDLLARLEATGASSSVEPTTVQERRALGEKIRENIADQIGGRIDAIERTGKKDSWWAYATVAEALFGLQDYAGAVKWLERGKAADPPSEWEYESTLRQLSRLAQLQNGRGLTYVQLIQTDAWKALESFFGHDTAAVHTAYMGKVGLALSGGGFRAALYHIGVLAKLAELDLLRHVEVLSCVSGGSIVGAHYYLELRKLLESKSDHEVTQRDYVDIVERIQRDFLCGVQRNIRTRVAAEFLTNLKMIFYSDYSRTKRAGELYEREIFSRVKDGGEKEMRWLNKLYIYPRGERPDFNPKHHNWNRRAKVPILILNATTLNTGHNWQFTASWMGEPPVGISSDIDANEILRRMYYDEAPKKHQNVRLGYAVGASACVPGIFDPLNLIDLYPDRTVRLADGGVCDNQGVSGLLEQDCSIVIVSDGSGQMESQKLPSRGLLGVPLRSNSILQARIRDRQYHELHARRRSSLLRGLAFVHLKEDLDADPVDWTDCKDPYDACDEARLAQRMGILTRYGISRKLQSKLAAVRTDLDSLFGR